MKEQTVEIARFEQIAILLAGDIVQGVYQEGEKISGRSTLAGKYNISPETVRKALALLQAKEVVTVVPNSGTIILSRQAAREFIDSFQEHSTLGALEKRLQQLTKERNRINAEIERVVRDIVSYKAGMLKNMQNAEEITLGPASPLNGYSLQETRLRSITGATVIAVRHQKRWYVSPDAELVLTAGDILLAVGTKKALGQLRKLAAGS
ncbi:MAG TPA: GntR family transcriptional regulator [Firmicutes bacterium]|jgi:K+/H+ antiporter YhaU regulatory subunit KhtT|nr:GntR family transcriptional regulator [Bacillota bacterium]